MIPVLAASLLYAAAFLAQYQCLTAPVWGYWGFGAVAHAQEFLYLLPLMVFPALFMPPRIDRPSALFAFVNYVILYVPSCVLLFHSTKTSLSAADAWAIFSLLAASTVLLLLLPRFSVPPLAKPKLEAKAILAACWCVLAGVFVLVVALNRVRLIGFKEIVSTRQAYEGHIRSLGSWFGYLDAWSGLVLVPLLLADCARKGKWWGCLLLCGVCAVLFLVTGRKTDLLAPLVVLGTYGALKRDLRPAGWLLVFSGLLLLPFGLKVLGLPGPAKLYVNVVNFRVFAVPQVLIPQYYAYYLSHGFTHFRSINLVNRLFYGGAPFEQPWSAIATYYYGKKFTADAVFYATDGLAALGILGVPCVTAALLLVFWIFDCVHRGHGRLLTLPAMMPFLFSLLNNSLFTTLLTGGGFLLLFLFYLLPEGT